MRKRQPPARDVAPVTARYRVRYRKAGRMRFSSARDFQRALERAVRRAGVPIAFSAGFSPHPRISYTNTVQTGVASEGEYLELGLTRAVPAEELRAVLAAGLPDGFDVLDVVPVATDDFAARLEASAWRIELPDIGPDAAGEAVARLMAADTAVVERLTKRGVTAVDARAALVAIEVTAGAESMAPGQPCAILLVVVRHVTPSVRPIDVLSALERAADLPQSQAPRICRLAQGPLDTDGITIGDPLEPDRRAASSA